MNVICKQPVIHFVQASVVYLSFSCQLLHCDYKSRRCRNLIITQFACCIYSKSCITVFFSVPQNPNNCPDRQIDGFAQDCGFPDTLAIIMPQFCTEPLKSSYFLPHSITITLITVVCCLIWWIEFIFNYDQSYVGCTEICICISCH